MTTAPDTLQLVIACTFLIMALYIIVVGLAFDVWYERRHLRRTGMRLTTLTVAVPLLTPFHCGMALLAPARAQAHGYVTSIHLAPRIWRWLAIGHVCAVILFSASALAWWLVRADTA